MKDYKIMCSINLPIKLRDKLEKIAQQENKHMSAIVREALEAHFAEIENNQKKK